VTACLQSISKGVRIWVFLLGGKKYSDLNFPHFLVNRGGSAGRVDATRGKVLLKGDTDASILDGVKIVQI
jgi:hypothetical protein